VKKNKFRCFSFKKSRVCHSWLLAMLTAFLAAAGCREKPPASSEGVNLDTVPTSEFFGPTELSLTEGACTRWRLLTTHIVRYELNKRIMVDPLTVYIFNENRRDSTTLTADSGETTDDLTRLTARGNVLVRTFDGKRLRTAELHWDKNTDQITSPVYVRMSTPQGDDISGVGFESDNSLNHWKLMKRVKARIENVEEKTKKLP